MKERTNERKKEGKERERERKKSQNPNKTGNELWTLNCFRVKLHPPHCGGVCPSHCSSLTAFMAWAAVARQAGGHGLLPSNAGAMKQLGSWKRKI